ncbi:MAG: hypothetical protein ABI353_16765 [Isosphaeraceae bacterium]
MIEKRHDFVLTQLPQMPFAMNEDKRLDPKDRVALGHNAVMQPPHYVANSVRELSRMSERLSVLLRSILPIFHEDFP